jgi:hypothetical protein
MRGDGHLHSSFKGPAPTSMTGGHSYDDTFIRKLITADPAAVHKSDDSPSSRYRVYNLHMATMGGPDNEVHELVEYVLKKGGAIEERIYKKNSTSGNTDVEIYTVNPTSQPVSKLHVTTTSWADTVKNMVPSGYTSYMHFFPMILFFASKVWDRGIREGTPIYGYINGLETSPTPPYGPVKEGQISVKDPITLAASFVKGEKTLLEGPPGTMAGPSRGEGWPSRGADSTAASPVTGRTLEVVAVSEKITATRDEIRIPTATCSELGYKLYPLQRY